MEDERSRLHVVVFPWLAFGHMIPYLELSKCLAQKGHCISFVCTPRNIQRLPKIPPTLSSQIKFVELPLLHVDNLPDYAEATADVPHDKIQYLKKAYDGLEAPLSRFLERSAPHWIIYDFAPHWLPPIATKLGVPCAYFNIFNASTAAFFFSPSLLMGGEDSRTDPEHFTVPPKWIPFPSNMAFRLHEIRRVFDAVEQNASGVTDVYRFASTVRGCNIMAVRSCNEIEGEWLRLLEEDLCRKPTIPVGLLPPSSQGVGDDGGDEWVAISEWMDKQRPRSVVYIAFGSESTPSEEETTKLALGLELSELPFFWVLRKLPCSDEGESSAGLPSGFEDRTRGRGVVCKRWAPQLRILGHPSVGGFLTHCGWSSIIEGLGFGLQLILLPLLSTQALAARLLQWKKIGIEIPRDERDGSFTREAVAESLKLAMVNQGCERLKAKAGEMREIIGDESLHDGYVDNFVRYLKEHRARGES